MVGQDEVIELSIEETQALRAKLGLPPLRGVRNSSVSAQSIDKSNISPVTANNVSKNGGKEEISLSVDETNALRLKIGLLPLKLSESNEDHNGKGSTTSIPIHAPPSDISAQREAQARVENASAKRVALEHVKRLEVENEFESEKNKNGGSALVFARKMRDAQSQVGDVNGGVIGKKEAKKKKTIKMAKNPRLALPSEEEEEGELPRSSYTSEDLKGMKVSHAASDFEAGTTTVLTLADRSILDLDPDSNKVKGLSAKEDDNELVNANIESDHKALDNLRKKRKLELGAGRAGGYAGFDDDEFEELGGIGTSTLSLGSARTGSAGARKGFEIGVNDASNQEKNEKNKSDLFSSRVVSLESRFTNNVASDYLADLDEEDKLDKKRAKQMKILEKLRKKDKKTKKKRTKGKRTYSDEEDEIIDNENQSKSGAYEGSLLEKLEATAVQQSEGMLEKRERQAHRCDVDYFANQKKTSFQSEDALHAVEDSGIYQMKEKRKKFDQIMQKGKLRTDKAFNKSSKIVSHSNAIDIESPVADDDAFLNAALAKARRLKRLKELSSSKQIDEPSDEKLKGENAVVKAVEQLKKIEGAKVSGDEGKGITFEFDEMQEFTRALRARADQVKRAPEKSRGIKAVAAGAKDKSNENEKSTQKSHAESPAEEMGIEELANEVAEDVVDDEDDGGGFGSTAGSAPIGRGMSNFLSLLKQTGEIKNSGREEMRGRAKDKRTYEDYENLDLKEIVKIDTRGAQEKDIEFANREIKLEYRDDFGRLLTRKEAYRNMCYQFHGHGSSKKNQERRLKQIEREREEGKLASRQVMAEGGVGTLGALKATQKATGKAFIVHKT